MQFLQFQSQLFFPFEKLSYMVLQVLGGDQQLIVFVIKINIIVLIKNKRFRINLVIFIVLSKVFVRARHVVRGLGVFETLMKCEASLASTHIHA